MPYIKQEDRERASTRPETAGELNYAITFQLIAAYQHSAHPLALSKLQQTMQQNIMHYYLEHSKMLNYECFNTIFGAVACAILEFRRRESVNGFQGEIIMKRIARMVSSVVESFYVEYVVPFEEGKIAENGDVYLI